MDRRSLIFLCFAAVCLVLAPATPAEHRWFPLVLTGIYLVLALASFLDDRSRGRR